MSRLIITIIVLQNEKFIDEQYIICMKKIPTVSFYWIFIFFQVIPNTEINT